jgi:tellurite resistance protein
VGEVRTMSDLEKFAARHDLDARSLRRWLLEAMVLGAVSDGSVAAQETDTILHLVATRDEFRGLAPAELRSDLETIWRGLEADGFHVRIAALAAALPRYAHRLLAFRGAVAVSMADGRLRPDEVDFLRQFQRGLGISEEDVVRAFEEAEEGDDLPVVPERVAPIEAYLDCLLMAAAADGRLAEEERIVLHAFIADRPEFDGIPEEFLVRYMRESFGRYLTDEGLNARLEHIADDLPSPVERLNAYGLAEDMVIADGELAPAEREFLDRLAVALRVGEARSILAGDMPDDEE